MTREDNEVITEQLVKAFEIRCRKCGAVDKVSVHSDLRFVPDGDGYEDRMGGITLRCVCGMTTWVDEPVVVLESLEDLPDA